MNRGAAVIERISTVQVDALDDLIQEKVRAFWGDHGFWCNITADKVHITLPAME